MPGSGYREPPALVRRGDGQMLQLTPLLYAVLEAVDGRRTYDEIAEAVVRGVRAAGRRRQRRHAGRRQAAAAGPAAQGRRLRARAQEVATRCSACAAVRGHRPGR